MTPEQIQAAAEDIAEELASTPDPDFSKPTEKAYRIAFWQKSYHKTESWRAQKCGQMVSIRPCDKELGGKTFLGVYLGEFPVGLNPMCLDKAHPDVVHFYPNFNPAIFVPDLNRVVFGMESWWGPIKSKDHLHQITDEDIENVWYVRALKELSGDTPDTPPEEPAE